jgi:hypothetical protein
VGGLPARIPRGGEELGTVGLQRRVDALHSLPLLLIKFSESGGLTTKAGLLWPERRRRRRKRARGGAHFLGHNHYHQQSHTAMEQQ